MLSYVRIVTVCVMALVCGYSTQAFSASEDLRDLIVHGQVSELRSLVRGSPEIGTAVVSSPEYFKLAVHSSTVEMVEYLISLGVDVNRPADADGTPLHIASRMQRPDVVHLLISLGADVNSRQEASQNTPIFFGAYHESDSIVESLVANGASVNTTNRYGATPLHYAQHLPVIKVLVKNGAAIDAQGVDGVTRAQQAIIDKDAAILEFLVSSGAKRDIFIAAALDDVSFVRHEINRDPAMMSVVVSRQWKLGVLHVAALWDAIGVLNELLGKGAKVNEAAAEGLTPLDCAMGGDSEKSIALLRSHGAREGSDRGQPSRINNSSSADSNEQPD